MRPLLPALTLVVASAPGVYAAEAPSPDAAIAAFNRAVDAALAHREAGRHEAALEALEEALRAIRDSSGPEFDRGRSRVRYYTALTLVALARLAEAEALLDLLASGPGLTAAEREVVQARLGEVRAELAAAREAAPGRVEIIALDEAGRSVPAAARIDGRDVGTTPLDAEVAPGEHLIELSGADLRLAQQTFVVAPGSSGRLVVRVKAVEVAPIFDPPAASWWLTGGGVVALGAAAALHLSGLDDDERARDGSRTTRSEASGLFAAAETKVYGAYGLYAVGGGLVVGGVAWMLTDGWDGAAEGRASVLSEVDVGLDPSGSLHVSGRF